MPRILAALSPLALLVLLLLPGHAQGQPPIVSNVPCLGGQAAGFPCRNVDLLAHIPSEQLNPPDITGTSIKGNDIWGWANPATGREYALVGLRRGTAFVDVTEPTAPVVVGFLRTAAEGPTREAWRGIKVIRDHALIVSETIPHGMQVVDLRRLPEVVQVAHYTGFGSAHNIVANEASGFAYAVGSDTCGAGLHMVDMRNPLVPTFAGCYSALGYVHDAQCLTYPAGHALAGRELCFAAGGARERVEVLDVTDKTNVQTLASVTYPGAAFPHQMWLTEDLRYMLLNDEYDEERQGINTTTYIWDVADPTQPRVVNTYVAPSTAIDHNLYIRGQRAFLSNYRAGLRILDITTPPRPTEIAFFDIYPADDAPAYNGAWGAYPYLPSGTVLVNGIEQGLFVLRPTWRVWLPVVAR